jgi:hypothetical protein
MKKIGLVLVMLGLFMSLTTVTKAQDPELVALQREQAAVSTEKANYNANCAGHVSTQQCRQWKAQVEARIAALNQKIDNYNKRH